MAALLVLFICILELVVIVVALAVQAHLHDLPCGRGFIEAAAHQSSLPVAVLQAAQPHSSAMSAQTTRETPAPMIRFWHWGQGLCVQ